MMVAPAHATPVAERTASPIITRRRNATSMSQTDASAAFTLLNASSDAICAGVLVFEVIWLCSAVIFLETSSGAYENPMRHPVRL